MVLAVLTMSLGCGGNRTKASENARVQFERAMKQYEKGKFLNAIEDFQVLVYNFPGADFIDSAQYFLAHSYYGNKDHEIAAVEFQRLVNSYPQSELSDDAQYMAGVCYVKNTPKHYGLDQEDLKRAITALNNFILDNPESPLIEEARTMIIGAQTKLARKEYENGVLYFKVLDYTAAKIYFQYVIDEYTDTEYAPKALFKLAEIEYRQKNYAAASERFNQFISIYENSELVHDANEYLEKISEKRETSDVAGDDS